MYVAPFASLPPLSDKRSRAWARHLESRLRGLTEEPTRKHLPAAHLSPLLAGRNAPKASDVPKTSLRPQKRTSTSRMRKAVDKSRRKPGQSPEVRPRRPPRELPPWRPGGASKPLTESSASLKRSAKSLARPQTSIGRSANTSVSGRLGKTRHSLDWLGCSTSTYEGDRRHSDGVGGCLRGQAALLPLPDAALARVATGEGSYNESLIEGGPVRPNLPLVPSFEARKKVAEEARRKSARDLERRRRLEALDEANRRRENKRRRLQNQARRLQVLRQKALEAEQEQELEIHEDHDDTEEENSPAHKQEGERTIRFMPPCDDSSQGSDPESSESSQDEWDGTRDPLPVRLPLWYPDEQPLQVSAPFGAASVDLPLSHLVPPAPTARCTGHDKVSVAWQLQGTRLLDFTWQVRVRTTTPDAEWQKVDLDSGVIESSEVTNLSWKHRACFVQKGLKVLSFCVEEGRKSQRPIPGTVVSHYPGLVTVDFELMGGHILRQRVPQDWVLLAATSREIKDVAWSLLETRFGTGRGGRRLWRVAKNKVYERIIRTHRQCAVLWKQQVDLPEPGCRVSITCAMGLQVTENEEKEDFSPDGSRTTTSRESRTTTRSISSWWPAVLPTEAEYDLRKSTDVPEELCARADLKVHLEPYPRIQVIPRHWICEELPESERAKRNICIGQSVLAHYAVSSVGSEEGGEVWGAHPEPREAGDVTLQFGNAHMAEKPDSEERDQARKFFFGAREVQHRSERAVRSKVLRELISPAEVYVYLQCMDKRKPVRVPLASIWSVQPNDPNRRTVRKRRKVLEWMVLRPARDRAAEVVARQGSSAGLYHPAYGYIWDEAIPLIPGVKVSFFSLPGRGDATTASVASLASPGGFAFRRLSTGTIVRTVAKVSHYEVLFDEVVPEDRWVSAFNIGHHLQPDGSVERLRRPELTIHDLPDDMHEIEVSVGLSAAFGGENVQWSAPSKPCRVQKAGFQPLPPLPPLLTVLSISRAQVRWILPKEPAPLCFRLRMRERGAKDWFCLDSFGHARDQDTTLAWRSRLVPLVEGLWVSAFGDFDKRKSSTPGAARVRSVDRATGSVEVEFVKPQDDFCIGGVPTSALACTQCSQKLGLVQDELHTIPFAWIEAVWVADGTNYLKGMPLASHTEEKQVLGSDGDRSPEILQLDDDRIQVLDERWQQLAKKLPTVKLTEHEVVGLKAEVAYEFSVQALTTRGWTEWSKPGTIQMPRIGYEQEQLVSERRCNALYRADLLPQALYKEYERCWDSVDESLTADRLDRVHQVLHGKKDLAEEFDHELSRWLVDMEGPIRESSRMLEAEARLLLKDLVSRKANVNYRDQATGRVPLTYACEYGWKVKTGIIEELLQLRADVDSMNDARHTALGIAAAGGHANIVEILLACGADATIVSLQGETALLRARTIRGMTHAQIKGINRCRDLLRHSRLPWESFEAAVATLADDPPATARAFLEIAFPNGPSTMFVADKEGKRISAHDKLRLYEQILEVREVDDDGWEEAERRGRFCAHKLLLPQVRAATLQQPPNTECNYFARYLLHSGVMRWCVKEAKELAAELLAHYDQELQKRRSALKKLPRLTEAEMLFGSRPQFAGRSLHQWHAHDDLPWLTEQNVVGTFEALVHSGAIVSMEDFCSWVGELNAQICASDGLQSSVQLGAWDKRLPLYFWGSAYTKFLMGEAQRAARIFHQIAGDLARSVGKVEYKHAPNKQPSRVLKKQFDYASTGLTLLHEALDLMKGKFRKAYRADLPGARTFEDVSDPDPAAKGVDLILARSGSQLHLALEAVSAAVPEGQDILVLVQQGSETTDQECGESARKGKERVEEALLAAGASSVVFIDRRIDGSAEARRILLGGLRQIRNRKDEQPDGIWDDEDKDTFLNSFSEKAQVLFDIRKCRTGDSCDLLCTGGCLDLVRGSLTCTTEEEFEEIYNLAMSLTVENDHATVVRVKNGFHSPAAGGYCDLKLFLLIAHDKPQDGAMVGSKVCHICELQVHLKQFLACKKYTHLPYVIDRGDFDQL